MVDKSANPYAEVPRYHLPNFPGTLTDAPGIGFMLKIWRRLTTPPLVGCVVMTDLFSNVPISMMCAGAGTPLVYSIHTDIAQLDGINCVPSSATFLQATTSRLAHAAVGFGTRGGRGGDWLPAVRLHSLPAVRLDNTGCHQLVF